MEDAPIDWEVGSTGAPNTGLGGLGVTPREMGIDPDPNPERDGDDGICQITGKYPWAIHTGIRATRTPWCEAYMKWNISFRKDFRRF